MDIYIVKAAVGDSAALLALHRELNRESPFVPFLDEPAEDALSRMQSFFQVQDNPYLSVFIGKDGEQIIGNIWVWRAYEPEWSHRAEFGIAVRGNYHRQGVGSRLLRAAEEWAVSQQCRRIALKIVHENLNALEFHLKRGYTISGTEKESYCVGTDYFDEYQLSKSLCPNPASEGM